MQIKTKEINETDLGNIKRKLKQCLEYMKIIIEEDYDNISCYDYYKIVSNILDIEFSLNDYLKYLSKIYCVEFDHSIELPTEMGFSYNVIDYNENIGKDSDKEELIERPEYFQVYYTAAAVKDFSFDLSRPLSIDELNQLIQEEKIVVLERNLKELDEDPGYLATETEIIPDFNFEFFNNFQNIDESKMNTSMFQDFISIIDHEISREDMIVLLKEYSNNIKKALLKNAIMVGNIDCLNNEKIKELSEVILHGQYQYKRLRNMEEKLN